MTRVSVLVPFLYNLPLREKGRQFSPMLHHVPTLGHHAKGSKPVTEGQRVRESTDRRRPGWSDPEKQPGGCWGNGALVLNGAKVQVCKVSEMGGVTVPQECALRSG